MKGKTAPLRRTIRLAAGYQLQRGPAGEGHTLMSAKGPIPLNETAALILELCNGQYTLEAVVARALQERGAGRQDARLEEDLRAFLDAAQRRGWIVSR